MNRDKNTKKHVLAALSLLCILLLIPVHAFSFKDGNAFIAHSNGSSSCVSETCHMDLKGKKQAFVHEPLRKGMCVSCHRAEDYPAAYGIRPDNSVICFSCHERMEYEVERSTFIHGPIVEGDCLSCHSAHGSGEQYLLRQSYERLCLQCHKLAGFASGKAVHKPVKDGNCGLCHDPHASDHRFRLTDLGANLCVSCHDDLMMGMTDDYVHAPLVDSGCTQCHDPHAGENDLRLTSPPEEMCMSCHEDKKNEVEQYLFGHKPVMEGQCLKCHSPHHSGLKYLLRDSLDSLCYGCHKESAQWKERQFLHGPVVQGNCTACHRPHGSDNAYILRLPFPHKFYAAYEKGRYSLCFNCHKEALVGEEKTGAVTHFRNGETNLHWLHVKQEKGRTCRACHDVHASDQEDHVREEFHFGAARIPIYYYKTDSGGTCIPGCHRERSYDREEMVVNPR